MSRPLYKYSLLTITLSLTPTISLPENLVAKETNIPRSPKQSILAQNTTTDEARLAEAEKLNQQVIELYQQGKYNEAIPFAQQALAIRKKVLGDKHPDTANSPQYFPIDGQGLLVEGFRLAVVPLGIIQLG